MLVMYIQRELGSECPNLERVNCTIGSVFSAGSIASNEHSTPPTKITDSCSLVVQLSGGSVFLELFTLD